MPLSTINNTKPLPFAVSLGEPAGIGPETILKAWMDRADHNLPDFFVVGSERVLAETARKLGLEIPLQPLSSLEDVGAAFPDALPVLDLGLTDEFTFGTPSTATAALTIGAIEKSVELIFEGKAAGLVTAPIQKSVLYEAGFSCPGHTEYLAELCQKQASAPHTPVLMPVMMLVSDHLRVVPLTIHMAITDVVKAITPELIRRTSEIINTALIQDFGLDHPRIAVAGLNPHAGEDGAMGTEEQRIITPALDLLRAQGMNIRGPLPADTLFHEAARATYDAALCMYHDQALIPIKTLDFDGGVNVTIGLPIIRTSPDHGTALDIAGKNLASANSMINALKQAQKIYTNRTRKNV
ncbi:MAG: 4-hydroxythreonine-4-phosphate dehydrogenase PdxA [Alphaproteobacteria bacterium]|nr:MAG: 4-hydroxythreonine-4-phosphate dehydrogenase PdxA [Alphaproteobacteria bacterium]